MSVCIRAGHNYLLVGSYSLLDRYLTRKVEYSVWPSRVSSNLFKLLASIRQVLSI